MDTREVFAMAAPGTPQNFRLTNVIVKDKNHALISVACDPVTGATGYKWFHEFGNVYTPNMRFITETSAPETGVGSTPPFIVTPGQPYTMAVEAVNIDGSSVPNVQVFNIPAYIDPKGPVLSAPFAELQASQSGDAFYVGLVIDGPTASQEVQFVFDTGAFEMLLDATTAKNLNLPNLGAIQVSGVGGASTAYNSEVSFTLGNREFKNVPCVVDSTFDQPLFGARFWITNKLAPLVDPVNNVIYFYQL